MSIFADFRLLDAMMLPNGRGRRYHQDPSRTVCYSSQTSR